MTGVNDAAHSPIFSCAYEVNSADFMFLPGAEVVNCRPGKGEVCTATSAMIASQRAPQQLVSDSFGPVVACYYALAKICHSPPFGTLPTAASNARSPTSVDNLSHRIGEGSRCDLQRSCQLTAVQLTRNAK